ncbi:EAL domain-containing protein [Thalassotalea euphylliae]|uniref:bifunctional diguanylate cyclase/phosphodiesterase n=1 Tax=Thalassotalea euphylliae TaxID=1655234 RepID=UPI003624B0D5
MENKNKNRSTEEVLLLSISVFAILVLAPFAYFRFTEQEWLIFGIDIALMLSMLGIFAMTVYQRSIKVTSKLLVAVAFSGLCGVVAVKGQFPLYWSYPVIIATYFMFPAAIAVFISLALLSILLYLVMDSMTIAAGFTFLATTLITIVFSYVFSKKMGKQHKKISYHANVMRLRNEALEKIVHGSDLNTALSSLCLNLEDSYPDMLCCTSLVDETGALIRVGAAPSFPAEFVESIEGLPIAYSVNPCAYAIKSKERVVVEDIQVSHQWPAWRNACTKLDLKTCWSEPIFDSNGQAIGTFAFYHRSKRIPSKKETALIVQVANLVSLAIERERANQLIWRQANYDQLTGLPNRNMMRDHLKQSMAVAKRDSKRVAVAFLDLDHFKDINDTQGHYVGDLFLQEIAKRLKTCLRATDDVARLGGDEFVVTMTDIGELRDVEIVCEHITKALSTPFSLKGKMVHSSVSIGVTIFPDDGEDIDVLLRNADQAMYGAKQGGRNSCHFFTESMREATDKRYQMIEDLRIAVEQNQFEVQFQPIVCLLTQEIQKAEALIRWNHPEKGLIMPSEFIGLAEETGLIVDIGDWVAEHVIELLSQWNKAFDVSFQISVNTSPLQYKKNSESIIRWATKLTEHCLPTNALCLEITENMLMSSDRSVQETVTALQNMGVEIAIDDFGTGYSSFGYLKKFATNYLKIDRSFVKKIESDPNELALCEAIVVMAKKLGINVVAEGIETHKQAQYLTDIGCHYGQGYHFAKPMRQQDFIKLVSQQQHALKTA